MLSSAQKTTRAKGREWFMNDGKGGGKVGVFFAVIRMAQPYQSPEARSLASMGELYLARAAEQAHLPMARGRIMDMTDKGAITNQMGKVDFARLTEYDPVHQTVRIRVDHSTCPSFWLEVDLPLAKLGAFIAAVVARQEEEGTAD